MRSHPWGGYSGESVRFLARRRSRSQYQVTCANVFQPLAVDDMSILIEGYTATVVLAFPNEHLELLVFSVKPVVLCAG